jgi:hypothetical protein
METEFRKYFAVVCFLLGNSPASENSDPEENIQHTEHGESFEIKKIFCYLKINKTGYTFKRCHSLPDRRTEI